jgi:hypothetical protein
MYGTCGDYDLCNKRGSDASDRAMTQVLKPYVRAAADLIKPSAPKGGRSKWREQVGGCPVCVIEDYPAFNQQLIDSVCCLDHAQSIRKWIQKHRRRPSPSTTVLCMDHRKDSNQAWILVQSRNVIEAAGQQILIGHAAFAFKRQSTIDDHWPDDAVWVCGSSDGVADSDSSGGGLMGTTNYWWSHEDHPLDQQHFQNPAYDFAKIIDVPNARWVEALIEADVEFGGTYCLITNNCADVAHRVLTAYGCQLPTLTGGVTPMTAVEWWNACPGRVVNLDNERRKRRRR